MLVFSLKDGQVVPPLGNPWVRTDSPRVRDPQPLNAQDGPASTAPPTGLPSGEPQAGSPKRLKRKTVTQPSRGLSASLSSSPTSAERANTAAGPDCPMRPLSKEVRKLNGTNESHQVTHRLNRLQKAGVCMSSLATCVENIKLIRLVLYRL